LFRQLMGVTPSEFRKKSVETKNYNFLHESFYEE
jgi:AraC-like DNA-binding protein